MNRTETNCFKTMRAIVNVIERFSSILSHRRFLLALLFLAFLLNAASLNAGWFADDYWHRLGYADSPEINKHLALDQRMNGPMRAYSFFTGPSEKTKSLMDLGVYPWWFNPAVRAAFWRPLTGCTFLLDYTFWPEKPFFMHVQNIAWFLFLAAASFFVYRKIMGAGGAAGLAALLFAIDDVHAMSAAWMANRHIVVAAAFGVPCLYFHLRWREKKRWLWAAGALIFFTLSLLASEGGIATFAYLLAYALILDAGAIFSRFQSTLPYVSIIAVWRIVYTQLGYGVYDISLYIDPLREPIRFMSELFLRIPIIVLGTLGWPPADLYCFLTSAANRWFAGAAFLVLALAAWVTRRLWKDCRVAQFWALGMLFSVIPLCSAIPSNRNLGFASLGAMGFLAQLVFNQSALGLSLPRRIVKRYALYAAFSLLFVIHCIIAPLGQFVASISITFLQSRIDHIVDLGNDPQIQQQDLILVNSPCALAACFLTPYRMLEHLPYPAHIRVLSPGSMPVQLKRIDEKTLLVRPKYGYSPPPDPLNRDFPWSHISEVFIVRRLEGLIRNYTYPAQIGERVELSGVSVEVTGLTEDQRIAEATFHFTKSLDDPSLKWMKWSLETWKYHPYKPPAIGETVTVLF